MTVECVQYRLIYEPARGKREREREDGLLLLLAPFGYAKMARIGAKCRSRWPTVLTSTFSPSSAVVRF